MYRTSLSRLLGGSLLFTAVAAQSACGGGDSGTGGDTQPSAGAPATSSGGATPGGTASAGKSGGSAGTSAGTAGAKATAGSTGSTTSPVASGAAGKSGAAGSSTAASAGSGAAGSGTASGAAGSGTASAAGTSGGSAGTSAGAAGGSAAGGGGGPLKFTSMFTMGMTIPKANKCPSMGDNKSPALSWTGGPADAKSYALVLFDTGFSLLHYALWDIPATVHELPEGLEAGYELKNPMGAHQAAAMCNNMPAYCGPCSGGGGVVPASTYEYRLYALKVDKLGLMESSTAMQAQTAIESMMLEKAVWTGKPE